MTTAELVSEIALENDITKKAARKSVEMVFSALSDLMVNNEVRVTGFGTFSSTKRAARTARNPKTGEPIQIPEKMAPKFSPATALKEKVNGE